MSKRDSFSCTAFIFQVKTQTFAKKNIFKKKCMRMDMKIRRLK